MTRSGVYRCPRCGYRRALLVASGAVRIALDAAPRRMICPREGADMTPLVARMRA